MSLLVPLLVSAEPTIEDLNERLEQYEGVKIAIEVIEKENLLTTAKEKHESADLILIYIMEEEKLKRFYDLTKKAEIEKLLKEHPIDSVGLVASKTPNGEFEKFTDSLVGKQKEAKKNDECTDSDTGHNTYVKGVTIGPTGNGNQILEHEDYCIKTDNKGVKLAGTEKYISHDEIIRLSYKKRLRPTQFLLDKRFRQEEGNALVEGSCEEGKAKISLTHKCPFGCKNGACIRKCTKLSGPAVGPGILKVVFIPFGFPKGRNVGQYFSDVIENTFNSYEPFKSQANHLSFWYVDTQGRSKINLKSLGDKKNKKTVQTLGLNCDKADIVIAVAERQVSSWINEGVNGQAPLGSNFQIISISTHKDSIPLVNTLKSYSTIMHEVGHGVCGLGHSFGGFNDVEKKENIPKNCKWFDNYPSHNILGDGSDSTKPRIKYRFQGCGHTDFLWRSTFSSVMDYGVLAHHMLGGSPNPHFLDDLEIIKHQIREAKGAQTLIVQEAEARRITPEQMLTEIMDDLNNAYSKNKEGGSLRNLLRTKYKLTREALKISTPRFNVIECSQCLKALGETDTSVCSSLKGVLGSDNFKCENNLDCIALYGECSQSCIAGSCIIDKGNECVYSYNPFPRAVQPSTKNKISPAVIPKNAKGICNSQGDCEFSEFFACNSQTALNNAPDGWTQKCLRGCKEDGTWDFKNDASCTAHDRTRGVCKEGRCIPTEG